MTQSKEGNTPFLQRKLWYYKEIKQLVMLFDAAFYID